MATDKKKSDPSKRSAIGTWIDTSPVPGFILIFVMVVVFIGSAFLIESYYPDNGSNDGSGYTPPPSQHSNVHYVEVEVNYSGHWSGLIMVELDQSSFDGYGYQRAGLNLTEGTYYYFSAQKMDWGYEKLELRLYSDGKQVKYAFTTSESGIASIAWTVS